MRISTSASGATWPLGSPRCSARRPSSSERSPAAAAVFWTLLDRTVFGRHVRAIGDNEKAAEYTGLPIRATKIWVYSLTGLLSGIAGVLYAAENHQGNPNAGMAYELDAIAAVVIGGTRLSGGKGTISGTIVGTLIMGVLTNMLRLNNVDSNVEMMIKAVIIVLAVAVQRERNMTRCARTLA
jgi:ribose transport system permease protein